MTFLSALVIGPATAAGRGEVMVDTEVLPRAADHGRVGALRRQPTLLDWEPTISAAR